MVAVGFVLLIIPGIYLTIKYQFYSYRIIDTEDGVVDALRQSGELTRDVKWQLIGFGLLAVLLNVGGMLLVLVGLFVTLPVTMIAAASVYRQLSNRFMPALQSAPVAPVVIPPAV